jgi:hypothetical protein
MRQLPDLPVAITSERDNDGRLVGLAFDSVPPLPTPETNPWLVAVDGSDNALRAVAHAVQQANDMNALCPASGACAAVAFQGSGRGGTGAPRLACH